MPWFKVDTATFRNRKLLALRARRQHRAIVGWLMLIAWAREQGSDGTVPPIVIRDADLTSRDLRALIDVELLEPNGSGYKIHGYDEHQTDPDQVAQERSRAAERQRRYRERHRNALRLGHERE